MKTITLPIQKGSREQPPAITAQIRAVQPGSSQPSPEAGYRLLLPDRSSPVPYTRLVVLVPTGEVDEPALARRVWQLASPTSLNILYLALSPDTEQFAYQRRRLVGLASLTSSPLFKTEISVIAKKNWLKALKQSLQSGDLLVCLAEDSSHSAFRRELVSEQLASHFDLPVYVLCDLTVISSSSSSYWIKDALTMIASIALIAVFFWLQVGIYRAMVGPQATLLLCLSVLAELYSLWKLNEWIG